MTQTATARKLVPLGDRILVRPKDNDATTKSGIVIPDTVKEKPQQGEVVAVGPGRVLDNGTRLKVDIKVGQSVLYSKYAGTEFKLDDDDYLIFRETDILGVMSA